MRKQKKANLKATSLAYSLLLILLISSISLSLILLNEYRLQFVNKSIIQSKLIDNSYSALNKFCNLSFKHNSYKWSGDLFGNKNDSIDASLFYHGIFKVNAVRSHFRESQFFNACFSGVSTHNEKGLQLDDSRYTVKIAGNTRLRGGISVPQAKVEAANLNSNRYNGDKLYWGGINESPKFFPSLDKKIKVRLEYLEKQIQSTNLSNSFLEFDSIQHSFHEETKVYKDTGIIRIRNMLLKDNIIIHSSKEIHLYNNNQIENIVLYAPIIRIENGFNGKLQIIARDSIILGEKVKLGFPSALIADAKEEKTVNISINEGCQVEGVIIAKRKDKTGHCTIEFKDGFEMHGWIYNEGQSIIKNAIIKGGIITQSIQYENKGKRETNLLLNVQIDPNAIPTYIKGMNFIHSDAKKEIFEWL